MRSIMGFFTKKVLSLVNLIAFIVFNDLYRVKKTTISGFIIDIVVGRILTQK